MTKKKMHILILGTTASGKSKLAFELAKKLDAEIISIDSMKVYKRMNIGTAKPPKNALKTIPHHLIDIIEPHDSFGVGKFLYLANKTVTRLETKQKNIIAVGGTALYIKALLYGLFDAPPADPNIRSELLKKAKQNSLITIHRQLAAVDPEAAARIHPNDSKRIIRALEIHLLTGKPISSLQTQFQNQSPAHDWSIIGLRRQKTDAHSRINQRVKKMLELGFVEEVKNLLSEEKSMSKQAASAIGYTEIIKYLKGQISLEKAIELIKKNTRLLAKHQCTWFKTFKNVNSLNIKPNESLSSILQRIMSLLLPPT